MKTKSRKSNKASVSNGSLVSVKARLRPAILRTVTFLLLLTMNAALLRGLPGTSAYLSDTESSSGNSFTAGALDFELRTSSATSSICATTRQPRTVYLHIANLGNPFKYQASSTNFSADLCDYVILEANLGGGEAEYIGPLKNFESNLIQFTNPSDWIFKMTVASNTPSALEGQVCDYNLNFQGSQTRHNLPFPKGFSDNESVDLDVQAPYCQALDIKTIGYWKNHSGEYLPHLPQTLGATSTDEVINTKTKVNKIFTASDSIMRNKLKKQLLAMKFNIAHFAIGDYYDEISGMTLIELASSSDALLRQDPPPSDSELELMKNHLDRLNNLGTVKICSCAPPPKDACDLRLTKTTTSTSTSPGDDISYHFTFDNVGLRICTGGGVRIRDTYGNDLEYVDYTSSRILRSFSKGTGYLEWNFGSVYPDDPLIELDLHMKVSENATCDTTLTNTAKFWSNETQWGNPITATSQIVCAPAPKPDVVINEFLPNPSGADNASKPNGEWVELYNKGTAPANVADWELTDDNATHVLPITADNTNTGDTTVPAGGFLVVYRNGDSDFALNNTGGDAVKLYNGHPASGATLIDSYTYTSSGPEGKSFARIPDGSDNWVDPIPTPGSENSLENPLESSLFGELIDFGLAVPEEGEDGYIDPNEPAASVPSKTSATSSTVETSTATTPTSTTEVFTSTSTASASTTINIDKAISDVPLEASTTSTTSSEQHCNTSTSTAPLTDNETSELTPNATSTPGDDAPAPQPLSVSESTPGVVSPPAEAETAASEVAPVPETILQADTAPIENQPTDEQTSLPPIIQSEPAPQTETPSPEPTNNPPPSTPSPEPPAAPPTETVPPEPPAATQAE